MTALIDHTDRRTGIGGSDAAAAVGLSPWKTPFQLWQEKTGQVDPPDLSDVEAVRFGLLLEDVVAEEFARRTGLEVHRVRSQLIHPKCDWMYGHLDRRIVGKKQGLECKTASLRMAKHWGEEGTDEIPVEYAMQCTHYMALTGYEAWHVAVLIAGNDYRRYVVERDEELIQSLIEREASFWSHVQRRDPPDPMTLADCAARWPLDKSQSVTAESDVCAAHDRLRLQRALIKQMESEACEEELTIKAAMGDASQLLAPNGQVLATWKAQTSSRFDQKAMAATYPELFKTLKVETQSRVFRLSTQRSQR